MITAVLDEVHLQRQIGADFTLNSGRPLLDISQFQAIRIDGNHSPSGETGILAYIHRFPRITAVPIECRKHLIIQLKAWIESVGNATPSVQVQWNIKHTER